jgi:hypothetical protein
MLLTGKSVANFTHDYRALFGTGVEYSRCFT